MPHINRSLFFRWFGETTREKLFGNRRRGNQAAGRRRRQAARLGLEQLEDRTLLSVLPAITPTGLKAIGAGNTPSIAYDPLNPQKMVAVFTSTGGTSVQGAFSVNGGLNWSP